MKEILNQQDMDDFLESFMWHDAFIREMSLISPAYVRYIEEDTSSVVASDALPALKIFISNEWEDNYGVEIIFTDVELMGCNFDYDLSPSGKMKNTCVEFSFQGLNSCDIRAKRMLIAILDKNSIGYKLRYAQENIFKESGQIKKPFFKDEWEYY